MLATWNSESGQQYEDLSPKCTPRLGDRLENTFFLFFFLKDYRLQHRIKPDPDGRYYFISQENKTVQMWAHTLVPHRNTLPKEIDVKKFDCTCCSFSIYSMMEKKN